MTCLPKQHLSLLLCFYIALQTLKGPLYSLWTDVSNETPVKSAKSSHIVPNRKAEIKRLHVPQSTFLTGKTFHILLVFMSQKQRVTGQHLSSPPVWRRCFHNVLTVCNPNFSTVLQQGKACVNSAFTYEL